MALRWKRLCKPMRCWERPPRRRWAVNLSNAAVRSATKPDHKISRARIEAIEPPPQNSLLNQRTISSLSDSSEAVSHSQFNCVR